MNKEYRFFISSTFKDMQAERDILRKEIFPEIEIYAQKYGVYISLVDLRWGIQTEDCESDDEASFKIFKTCFEEIDDAKPFFIGLLGQRYGWIPDISKLSLGLDTKYRDYLKYNGKSITEAEMLYAIEKFGKDNNLTFIYGFRTIKSDLSEEQKSIYLSDSKEDLERINDLKNRLEKFSPESCFEYDSYIECEQLNLQDFTTKMKKHLISLLDKLNENENNSNPIDDSLKFQLSNIEYEHTLFGGRKNELSDIDNFISGDKKLLAIKGVSGIGKSSLLKEIIYKKYSDNQKVLFSLLGYDDQTKDVRYILRLLYYQAKNYLSEKIDSNILNIDYVEENYYSLVNELAFDIEKLSRNNRVYIFLDGLDQLDLSNESLLSFLNTRYLMSRNSNVRIIVSYIGNDYINKELVLNSFNIYELNTISNEDITLIVKNRLLKERKELNSKCLNSIIEKKNDGIVCASNPIYLVLLIQYITNLDYDDFKKIEDLKKNSSPEEAIYNYINNCINNLPRTINGQLDILMSDAKEKISEEFVFNAIGIISMSQHGIREQDIIGIFNELNLNYQSSDFFYLKKLFRNFITFNSHYYDFNHKIIDNILEHYYFVENSEKSAVIIKGTIDYLNKIDDDFKKREYLYYAYKLKDPNCFHNYLKNHLQDDDINYFYRLINEIIDDDNFLIKLFSLMEENVLKTVIEKSYMLNNIKAKSIFVIMLNTNISYENTVLIYIRLAEIELATGNINDAKLFSTMAYKMSKKRQVYRNESFKIRIDVLLKTYNFYTIKHMLKHSDNISLDIINQVNEKINSLTKRKEKSDDAFYDYETFISYLSEINSIDELYANKDKVERLICKYHYNSKEILKLLMLKYSIFNDRVNNINCDYILKINYLEFLIGKVELLYSENGIDKIENAYNNYKSVYEIIEEREDLYQIASSSLYLSKFKKIDKKNSKKYFNKYNQMGENQTYSEKKSSSLLLYLIVISFISTFVFFSSLIYRSFFQITYIQGRLNAYLIYIEFFLETVLFLFFYPAFYYGYSYITKFNKYDFNGRKYKKRFILFGIASLITLLFLIITAISIDRLYSNESIFLSFNLIYGSSALVLLMISTSIIKNKNKTLDDRLFYNYFKKRIILPEWIMLALNIILFLLSFVVYDLNSYFGSLDKIIELSNGLLLSLICIFGLDLFNLFVVIFFFIVKYKNKNEFK